MHCLKPLIATKQLNCPNSSKLAYNLLDFQLEKGRGFNQNKIFKIIPMKS